MEKKWSLADIILVVALVVLFFTISLSVKNTSSKDDMVVLEERITELEQEVSDLQGQVQVLEIEDSYRPTEAQIRRSMELENEFHRNNN